MKRLGDILISRAPFEEILMRNETVVRAMML